MSNVYTLFDTTLLVQVQDQRGTCKTDWLGR